LWPSFEGPGPEQTCVIFWIAAISDSNAYAICGGIYTVDEEDSTADCILVENGVILAIGDVGT
jgi:hypothetical protein